MATSNAVHFWLRDAAQVMADHSAELNELDRAIGDGDHGSNMSRGLESALTIPIDAELLPKDALKQVGMALVSTVGGASGPLFGTFFLRVGQYWESPPTTDSIARAVRAGVDAVMSRGKAVEGDKTMVDALAPAAASLEDSALRQLPLVEALALGAQAAADGAQSTLDMVARRGRASYLGERSAGHLDPGAISSSLILASAARHIG
ncbi:MAG: dihydroxyacetone kinase subunit DhaL [Propionibacteriaceae bacterium]|nr:dihydroxyacetone kinase subunit DhaL [Propionibacteriaceae bacterium]